MKIAKKDRPYRVVPYDPTWPEKFEKERAKLADIFGDAAKQIEHVGSTSVPGMWAKPQIDILIIVDDLAAVKSLISKLAKHGYEQEDFNISNQLYFVSDAANGERLVSVHVQAANDPQAFDQIYFRDYLRSHPADCQRYSTAKQQAYNNGLTNRADYPAGKRKVLQEILAKALKNK